MIETISRERRSIFAGDKIMSHFPFRGSPPSNNTQVIVFFSLDISVFGVLFLLFQEKYATESCTSHNSVPFSSIPFSGRNKQSSFSRNGIYRRRNIFIFRTTKHVLCARTEFASKIEKTLVNILSHSSFHWRFHGYAYHEYAAYAHVRTIRIDWTTKKLKKKRNKL